MALSVSPRLLGLVGLLFLVGCPPVEDTDKETGTGDTDDTDSGDTNDTDTGETGDTDTGETGDTADTSETGDTGEPADVFAAYTDQSDLLEVTDVAVTAEGVYVTGFNLAGDAGIWWIDSAAVATELYAGAPLVQPTGIAISADGNTVYLSDLGVPSTTGAMNGAVYSMGSGGGALNELGADDSIDLPGDVAEAHGGSGLYVSGFDASGNAAIFTLAGGVASVVASGGSFVDPTAIAVDPSGDWLFVVDSLAADGRAALIALELPAYDQTVLASGFQVAFPGGVGTDGASLWYTTIGDPGLIEMAVDGSAMMITDTLGLMELPGGVGVIDGEVYVTEIAHDVGADLYLLSY